MLLKGGCIVNSDRKYFADVLIENNIIKQIGVDLVAPTGVKIINVTDKLIIPGGIDPSTNFNLNADHKDVLINESRLALEGGTTSIINRVSSSNEGSAITTLQKLGVQMKNQIFCNFGFYVTLNTEDEHCVKDMKDIVQTYGINCFEINIDTNVTKSIVAVMKECTNLGCLLRIRAHDGAFRTMLEQNIIDEGLTGPNGFIRSRLIEDEIQSLYQILKLNLYCQSALFIPQVMNKETAAIIASMKKNGRSIFCETVTAALVVDGDRYFVDNWDEAAAIVTDPPFRKGQTTDLIRCLQNGDIDMLSSQHTAVSASQRSIGQKDFREIPHGIIGVKERMAILWDRAVSTGIMDECQFVAATSANAAKLFNMYPKRGHIATGNIADLVVWDPLKTVVSSTNGHNSSEINIFDGASCQGGAELVIVGGSIKCQHSSIVEPASGERIDLKSNCGVIVDKLKQHGQREQLGKVAVEHKYSSSINAEMAPSAKPSGKETDEDGGDTKTGYGNQTQRPLTSSGNRNMQDSSFAFSGAQIDDNKPKRSSIRTNQPPGGKSSNIW